HSGVAGRKSERAHLDSATNGEIGWRSAGLRRGVSGSGSWKGAGPEAGAPVEVARCAQRARRLESFLEPVGRKRMNKRREKALDRVCRFAVPGRCVTPRRRRPQRARVE